MSSRIQELQLELRKWQQFVRGLETQHIILFEGIDAAGKSGAIKRFMEHINPRYARVVALDKPTEREAKQWYWQRYINEFPKAGEICFFDRSWYNRPGVEHVMGFCTNGQVKRFYEECPVLEKIFTNAGIRLTKFWFNVNKEEQQKRFESRMTNPLKAGKMSAIDLAGQTKWDEYQKARDKVLSATATPECPWVVIDSNDKTKARIAAMQYILSHNEYLGKDLSAIGEIDRSILRVDTGI